MFSTTTNVYVLSTGSALLRALSFRLLVAFGVKLCSSALSGGATLRSPGSGSRSPQRQSLTGLGAAADGFARPVRTRAHLCCLMLKAAAVSKGKQ